MPIGSRPSILDSPDFTSEIGSPFSGEVFFLDFNEATRNAWHASGIASANYDSAFMEDSEDPKEALWWIDADLGSVRFYRTRVDGRTEQVEHVRVGLRVERDGNERTSRVRVECSIPETDSVRNWRSELTNIFHGVVTSLCEGSFPPPVPDGVGTPPENSAEALIRGNWDRSGTDVYQSVTEPWGAEGHRVDLQRVLDAIALGDRPRYPWGEAPADPPPGLPVARWGIVRRGGRVALIWPLLTEVFQVELTHLDKPIWIATRYWLQLDIGEDGRILSVTICIDEDPTFRAEADDDNEDDLHRDLLSETGHAPLDFVLGFHADDE